MGISLISISHKVAPIAIRELFAFSEEKQQDFMNELLAKGEAAECVFISTCNRTEVYTWANDSNTHFVGVKNLLLQYADALSIAHIEDYVRFYQGSKAVRHLFRVAAGLDSLVIGEDQILGQVKRAHEQAREYHVCGVYLNTLFRHAVTAAKKVKTDTELSRTSVSTATMAVKAAEHTLGTLNGKKVMLIGASGQIGSVVLKNLQCIEGVEVYITARNMGMAKEDRHHKISYRVMEYEKRYELAEQMDVIISATSSPHYTLTYDKMSECFNDGRTHVLIDLAVPLDIDVKVDRIQGVVRYDMDAFAEMAKINNERKQHEVLAADQILEDCRLDFERWMVYQQSLPEIARIKERMLLEAEKKGFEKAIDKMFYTLRDHSSPEELKAFFEHMKAIQITE